jgi:cell division septation protein DedD
LFDDEPIRNAHETLSYLSEPYREDYSLGLNAIPEPVLEPASEQPSLSLANVELAVAATALETDVPKQADEIATSDFQIDPMSGDQPSMESVPNEFVTDPLDGPIEGWSFVPSDYPILINAPDSSRLERFRLPLVAGILICLGVAGYFLIYRSSIQASQHEETAQIQPGQTKHTSADQPFASQASLAGAPAKAVITAANAGNQEGQSARAANESSKGGYSLQAAAFPNEAGANEFCERLKRAGVPAYVVSAEIAGRGKWFRVRVGKFETTQQADKFASEARLRARASGLNLQLIVSAYDKP